MTIIKKLSEAIEEELEDAEHYAKMALAEREANPGLARVLNEISGQELNHSNMLHGEVVKLIEAYRKEHGEPPAAMQAVYDFIHQRHIAKAHAVKVAHAQFREG